MNPHYWRVERVEFQRLNDYGLTKVKLVGDILNPEDHSPLYLCRTLQTALFPTTEAADLWARNAAVIHGLKAVHEIQRPAKRGPAWSRS